jgi:predicted amidohydrolase
VTVVRKDGRVRAAVVQLPAGDDKAANLARLTELVRRAADLGAELVVGPEAAMHDFGPPDRPLGPVAEPLDGAFVTGLCETAADLGVTVVAGMFESADGGRAYNTVVAVGPSGLLGAYRKLHLFDALGWVESERLAPGDGELLVVPCGGLTLGVQTCYDVRFPELSRALVDRGVDVLVIPAAWVAGPLKEQQWRTLVAARAIESTAYAVTASQSPPRYVGCSQVVDPLGVPLATVATVEGVAVADLTPERVAEVRAAVPSLQHRRFRVVPD